MSFDARSLERLQELGRTLPQPLASPTPVAKSQPKASERRHRVEIEDDPQALFRELMLVSPDGTVPPHLMARLKEAESRQKRLQQPQRPGDQPGGNPAQQQRGQQKRGQQKQTSLGKPDPRTAQDHGELYTAFQQLLLEDEGD